MKDDQACFLEMMSFFLMASAFLHADLFSVERRERRHSFSAYLALFTTAWHSDVHHGRRGSFGRFELLQDIFNISLLVSMNAEEKESYNVNGSMIVEKSPAESLRSSSEFHFVHLFTLKIHDGGLLCRRVGLAFKVVMMGRWSLPV
jgi:hypothetical protein